MNKFGYEMVGGFGIIVILVVINIVLKYKNG